MFAIEIAIIAVCFIAHIFRLTQRGMLSFRFAPLAEKLKLTPSALLAAISTIVVVVILIQLSVSISGNQRKMDTLVRENALLKEKLDITLKDHKSDSTE